MRSTALALLLASAACAQEGATFPTWTPAPGDAYGVEIERTFQFSHVQTGGEVEPLDQSDGQTTTRRLRVRHSEGGAVEIEYLEDESSIDAASLAGRIVRARPPGANGSIELEVVRGDLLHEGEQRLALEDAEALLAGDPRAILFAGRPAGPGSSWTIDDPAAAALFCGFDAPRDVKIKVAVAEERRGAAILAVTVRIRATRTEGPLASESEASGSGELAVDAATGRVRSWNWAGSQSEIDRLRDDGGKEMVLRYDRTEEVRVEYDSQ